MSTNVSLTNELEYFIQSKIKTGFYASTSEVIRAGLRLLKEQDSLHDAKLEVLKEEIQKGLKSGNPTPLNMDDIRSKARVQFEASE